jgi:SAM-dependent methyltransferase
MIDIKKLVKEYLGFGNYIEVPFSKKLTGGKAINISKYSGLVSVIKRRSSKTIAENWSKKIYGKSLSGDKYTSHAPVMISRQTYVLETILSKINLKSKSLVDVGAGEGMFLNMLKKKKISLRLFGIEPSKKNCTKIKKYKIKSFNGRIEEYNPKKIEKKFDVATLIWTLCNCSNAYEVIESTSRILKKNGYIVVAEGSRIMVPFKKPIQMYFGKNEPDLHPFHFSKNTLCSLLILNKFKIVHVNRYIDSDFLLIIAKKVNKIDTKSIKIDNYKKVKSFFVDWYKHSKLYKSEIVNN